MNLGGYLVLYRTHFWAVLEKEAKGSTGAVGSAATLVVDGCWSMAAVAVVAVVDEVGAAETDVEMDWVFALVQKRFGGGVCQSHLHSS